MSDSLWGGMGPPLRAALAGGTALGLTWLLTPWVRRLSVRLGWVSRPVEERWGKRAVARFGGAAMFIGFLVAVFTWVPLDGGFLGLMVGLVAVFILGLVDDLRRIPPYTKLLVQLIVGCVVAASGTRIELIEWTWLSIPLSVFWFVFVMNAFNLLDNMDGLAAGTGALAAGFCVWFAGWTGQWSIVMLGSVLCGVSLGFLRYNFPPAKIYMGDSGSHFLGLSLAALALLGSWQNSTQLLSVLVVPALVLAVPIFDTCFVIIQRQLHRRHPFTGGADHISHRLAILGLSVRQTVVALYALSAGLGLLSVISVTLNPVQALIIWLVVLTALVLFGLYLAQVKVYRLETVSPIVRSEPLAAGPVTLIETMLLHKRRLLEVLVDFMLLGVSYVGAYLLRFEGALGAHEQQLVLQSLPVLLVIKLSCFGGFGLYRGVWRYVSLSDMIVILKAVALGSVLSALTLLYFWRFEGYSRAIFVIDGMLTFLLVGSARVLERLMDDWIGAAKRGRRAVLILGAGETGVRVLRHLQYERSAQRRVVGFIDDDPRKIGTRIHGSSVIGSRRNLASLITQRGIEEILIAIHDPSGELLEQMRRLCEPSGVSWRVVRAGVTDVL
ncbi:MAG: hypothetical protein HYY14_05565 [Candidatus Omnitrophica bacterium]|nr:hypothetical protein [Candidatus Omnitrophota bacterium]